MKNVMWPDIFVNASDLDFQGLVSQWPRTVSGQLQPIGASAFGDLFFQRANGNVERLDVLEGGTHFVASSYDEFKSLMNSPAWQEQNLLTQGVALLLEKNISRGPNQFWGFAPHPALVGKIDWARVMPLDAVVWHSICAQVLDSHSLQA